MWRLMGNVLCCRDEMRPRDNPIRKRLRTWVDLGGQVKAHDAETDFLQVCVRADLQGNKILALVERNLFLGSHGAVTAQPLLPSLLV